MLTSPSLSVRLPAQCCHVSTHTYLYRPSVAMSVLTFISLSTQCYHVSTHTYLYQPSVTMLVHTHIPINPVLPCQYTHISLSTQCCHVSTHVVLIKHPKHQGREFGRVPLREELLIYLDEALQQMESRLVDQSLSVWRQKVHIVCAESRMTSAV